MQLIDDAAEHQNAVAIVAGNQSYSYGQLLESSAAVASQLLAGTADLSQARVAYLFAPGFEYLASLLRLAYGRPTFFVVDRSKDHLLMPLAEKVDGG